MKIPSPVFLLLLALGTSTSLPAADRPVIFEDIDTNHNGAISKEEAKVREDLAEDFAEYDTDGNGSLSVDEYSKHENEGRMAPEDVEVPEPGAAPVM